MEQQQRDKNDRTLLKILAGMFIFVSVAGLIGIVMAAIAGGSLEELIGGVAKFGLVIVALAFVFVLALRASADPLEKIGNTRVKMQQEANSHVERMADRGFLPRNKRYEPIALPDPVEPRISTQGDNNNTVAPYRKDAIELLALTRQWHTLVKNSWRDPHQIIIWRDAQKDSTGYFADFDTYHHALEFLFIRKIAEPWMEGDKNKGSRIIAGTLDEVYAKLRGEALPPPQ